MKVNPICSSGNGVQYHRCDAIVLEIKTYHYCKCTDAMV